MPPHTRTASLLILPTDKHATILTLLALRDAHGPTLLLRVSPLALLAQLNIRDVLLEITITGNHAWTPITLAYPGALSGPRVCPLPLAFLALIPSPNVTCTGIKTGKFVNTTIVIAK